jgi:ATP-dependent Lon protease
VIRQFDPEAERLVDVLREIKNANWDSSGPPLIMTLIAPLPFLKKEGIRPEDLGRDADFLGLRIFAGCCTAENVPIRDCRTMLARFFSFLVKFTDELLEQCPFLAREDGVYAPTVAFIPEKYRIDARRAEEILDRGLLKWLNIISGESEEPEHPMVQPAMKI